MDKKSRSLGQSEEREGIRVIGDPDLDEGVLAGRSVFADDGDDTFAGDEQTGGDEFGGDEFGGDDLPHWTEPPTGGVNKIESGDSWTGSQPRWLDDRAVEFDEAAEFVFGDGADVESHDFFEYDETPDLDDLDDDLDAEPSVVALDSRRSARRTETGAARQGASVGTKAPTSRDDMMLRVATGLALAVAALITFRVGPKAAVVLVAVVLGLAVAELFTATRRAGYQPAALLGIVATVAMPLAIYWRGVDAIPLVLFLTIAFAMVWFLVGVGDESPLLNVGVTALGVVYVGVFGSFAALMLARWGDDGIGILLGAVVATAAYDIGGLFVGRAAGRSPLSAASPNKTLEGLLGGMAVCILVSTVVVSMWEPWGTWKHGFVLGIAAAIAAPLGDLCESLIKRDLGVKDMGSILPGHGGLLDRFDALLFVLPVTYEVARLLDLGV